jgi:hypothetical protein
MSIPAGFVQLDLFSAPTPKSETSKKAERDRLPLRQVQQNCGHEYTGCRDCLQVRRVMRDESER